MTTKHHTCCGQRIRARVIDGKLVEQPHQCQNSGDTNGLDWAAIQAEQMNRIEERD